MVPRPLPATSAEAQARLDAFLARDEAREVRRWRVHVTALLSTPLAALAARPELFGPLARRAVLATWALSTLSTALALVEEWRLARRGSAVEKR